MEELKNILHNYIDIYGIDSYEALVVSEYLDSLISKFQTNIYNDYLVKNMNMKI